VKPSPIVLAALLGPAAALAAPGDRAGCADHPPFPTRIPQYTLSECRTAPYDAFTFLRMKAPARTEEGQLTSLFYLAPPQKGAAALEIVRNYEAAITKAGGTVVDVDPRHFVYGKFVQNGQEISRATASARSHRSRRTPPRTAGRRTVGSSSSSSDGRPRSAPRRGLI
jgi:hypothetical protein